MLTAKYINTIIFLALELSDFYVKILHSVATTGMTEMDYRGQCILKKTNVNNSNSMARYYSKYHNYI